MTILKQKQMNTSNPSVKEIMMIYRVQNIANNLDQDLKNHCSTTQAGNLNQLEEAIFLKIFSIQKGILSK